MQIQILIIILKKVVESNKIFIEKYSQKKTLKNIFDKQIDHVGNPDLMNDISMFRTYAHTILKHRFPHDQQS